jgi:hypothetical protein
VNPTEDGTSTATAPHPRRRRAALLGAALLTGGALLLTACGGGNGSGGHGTAKGATGTPTPKTSAGREPGKSAKAEKAKRAKKDAAAADRKAAEAASAARISIAPANGTTDASINASGRVSVASGTLTTVRMTSATGATVPGALSADATSWQPSAQLARSTHYEVTATAKDAKGRTATEHAAFTTVSPAHSFIGTFTPEAGSTVGVGMPVSFSFDKAITDRKAVQSHITVSSSSGQQVVGHWFGSNRLDFRPQDYWQAGSTVTVHLDLDGVAGAPGVTGVQQKSFTFHIGHRQISTVDARTDEMTVVENGRTVRTIPISAGAPEHTTYNGVMVISQKFTETDMNGATVGFKNADGKGEYDIKDVPHAMRLTNSGTFIHGNYWGAKSVFGHVNTSHGCIGLSDTKGAQDITTPAYWFFQHSLVGDVVVVKNSADKTVDPANGLNGWNLSWSRWKAGSAL